MNRCRTLVLAISVLAVDVARANETAKAVVERAIKAHGGAENLAKLRVMRWKAKGKTTAGGREETPFTIEIWRQWPEQMKTVDVFNPDGNKSIRTMVIDGETGWSSAGDDRGPHRNGIGEYSKENVSEDKESIYVENLERLAFREDKTIEVALIGESIVHGRKANGIVVKSKGRPDVKLYFDAKSSLLVKRETPVVNENPKRTVVVENIYDDFRPVKGVVHWHRMTALGDGKKFTEIEVTEIEFFRRLDKKVFAKPKWEFDDR